MKPYIVLLLFFFAAIRLSAQTGTFNTVIDPDEGDSNNNPVCIVASEDGLLVVSASLCFGNSLGCTDMVKIDWNADILWKKLFLNLPYGFSPSQGNTILNSQGNYVMLGGTRFQDTIAKFIMEISPTGDSLTLQTFGWKVGAMGKLTQMSDSTYLILYTKGEYPIYAHPVLAFLNTNSMTTVWEKYINEFPWGSGVDMCLTENEWIISYQVAQGPIDYLYLTYTDTAGNVRSNIPVNPVTDGQCIGKVVYLGNGNLAVSWCNDTLIGAWGQNYGIPHFVAGMDTAGNILWQHYFAAPYQKKINRLRRASNGDIIGCGGTNNPAANYYTGWLFRFSPNGELLWEREFYHPSPYASIGSSGIQFNDLTETPDGGIAATGFFQTQTEIDIWLVKTDANGCMEAGCNDSLIWLSAYEAAEGFWVGKPLRSLFIYPNPANTHIAIQLSHNAVAYMPAQIDIYNIHGQQVLTHPLLPGQKVAQIDLPPLPKGIYLVHLKGKKNLSAKLVIE